MDGEWRVTAATTTSPPPPTDRWIDGWMNGSILLLRRLPHHHGSFPWVTLQFPLTPSLCSCRVDRDGAGDVGSLRQLGWPDPGEATNEENFTGTSATTTTTALPCRRSNPTADATAIELRLQMLPAAPARILLP